VSLAPAAAFAHPPLTTIQDTLYKADGTKFSGLLNISGNSLKPGICRTSFHKA
jgi:hypothetical protein